MERVLLLHPRRRQRLQLVVQSSTLLEFPVHDPHVIREIHGTEEHPIACTVALCVCKPDFTIRNGHLNELVKNLNLVELPVHRHKDFGHH